MVTKSKRIDWSAVVFDLERAGFSLREIGVQAGFPGDDGVGKVWVHRLKNVPGTQPKFHQGALLIGFWFEVTKQGPEGLPADTTEMPPRPGRGRMPSVPVDGGRAQVVGAWFRKERSGA